MSHYKPYQAYKDSSIEWIGKVPEHWNVKPLKIIASCNDDSLPESVSPDTPIRYVDISAVSHDEGISGAEPMVFGEAPSRARRKAKVGDVVVSTVRIYLKAVASVDEAHADCVYSTGFAVLRARSEQLAPEFLKWLALNDLLIQAVESHSEGLSYPAINSSELVNLKTVVPGLPEQKRIASILDRETARIDALIAKKSEFIELLATKRQALITHAVTKGLDSKAKVKDSGVEWIGEVPEHWIVAPIKRWFDTVSGATPDTSQQAKYYAASGGMPWIRTTDLNNGLVRDYEIGITEDAINDTACKPLPVGAILIAMYGGDGTIGKNGRLGIIACINQAICALLPSKFFDMDYAFTYIQFYRPHWMIDAASTRKDPNISQELIRSAPITRPPLEEQRQIVQHLKTHLARIDLLARKTQHSITLLKKRRSALITAAVTGQIDLRESA